MNHKPARLIKNHKTATALVILAAVAAVLVTSTAAVGTGHTAFADNGNNTKGFKNDGISLPTNTKQNQECQTAGGVSQITGVEKAGSCTTPSLLTPLYKLGELLVRLRSNTKKRESSRTNFTPIFFYHKRLLLPQILRVLFSG